MEIGLFQLENLIHSRARFSFFDLRTEFIALPEALEAVLSSAVKLGAGKVEEFLAQNKIAQDAPIIFLSEDGVTAESACAKLERAGCKNVYVIEGGVVGLLAELRGLSSSTK